MTIQSNRFFSLLLKAFRRVGYFFERLKLNLQVNELGQGAKVLSGVLISGGRNITIGKDCFIGRNVVLDSSGGIIRIGDKVEIRDNTRIYGRDIQIGSGVTLGEGVMLKGFIHIAAGAWLSRGCDLEGKVSVAKAILGPYTSCIGGGDHARDASNGAFLMNSISEHSSDGAISIEEGCWTGTRSILLKNVILARNTAVGAGAVVTKSFPAGSILTGVPAIPRLTQSGNGAI